MSDFDSGLEFLLRLWALSEFSSSWAVGYWEPVGGDLICLVSFSAFCSGYETCCGVEVTDGEMGTSGKMILRHLSDLLVGEDFKWDSFYFASIVPELFSLLNMLNLFFSSCSTELVFLLDIITFGVNFAGEFD